MCRLLEQDSDQHPIFGCHVSLPSGSASRRRREGTGGLHDPLQVAVNNAFQGQSFKVIQLLILPDDRYDGGPGWGVDHDIRDDLLRAAFQDHKRMLLTMIDTRRSAEGVTLPLVNL